jgi:ABC-type multidrug transport system fused ATPase/permease subunit
VKGSALSPDLPNLLTRLWRKLSGRRQVQFGLLLGLMLVSALAEAISLGVILPFLGVLTAPEKVLKYPLVAELAQAWSITSADQLVLPLTIAFATTAVLAGSIRLLLLWANARLALAAGADLSVEAYRRTLYQPFQTHVARNSSEVIDAVTGKVASAINVLRSLLTGVSSAMLIVTIMFALLAIDAVVATVAAAGFGASYALITWFSRRRLYQNSRCIARESIQVQKALQEGLGGIRDVLLDGTQPLYCDVYRRSQVLLMRKQASNAFIAGSPRFVMEALGMVLIAALAYGLSQKPGGVGSALPVLGALALGAQRLLPALQQSYAAWASIVGNQVSLADALHVLEQPLPEDAHLPMPQPLVIAKDIRFESVGFRYGSDGPWVLDQLALTIPKGARVGFVGTTGSGKSTTLDLLMGLLEPTNGQIFVDGVSMNGEHRRAWQRSIAHVPQSIYLADTTVAENIAFGVPPDAIDLNRVRRAARQAQIADFIESRADGYQAFVGERGIRLSGGQRQRIGIARALYKEAAVLVFDEATSALDNATEQAVMDAIENLDQELTILIIAHRLSTVQRCDTIIELDQGRVVAHGTYEQLLERSPTFRKMAQAVA